MFLPAKDIGRHSWHMFGGMFLPVLYIYTNKTVALSVALVYTFVVLSIEAARFLHKPLNHWIIGHLPMQIKEHEKHGPSGTTYLTIGSTLAILFFSQPAAVVGISFLAVGDACAAMIGKTLGRHKILNNTKSIEGTAACLICCLIVGLVLGWWHFDVAPWIIVIGAVVASIIELFNFKIDDNVLIPVVCAGILHGLSVL